MADELARARGRTITHVDLPPNELRYGMTGMDMPDEVAGRLVDLECYFRSGAASRVTDDIEQVTGRAPRRFVGHAREIAPQLR